MTPSHARELAHAALIWLCGQEELLPVFLTASGASAGDLMAALRDPGGMDDALLGAGLDFILMRDETVIAASAAQGIGNDRLAMAQAVLSGAGQMHWT
ncbi:MAG: DUF3572 family protein [Rhodobacteraceae bacterium]|nr:MAG: DUF3572 family protein [Paracoccaceae bacterium]